ADGLVPQVGTEVGTIQLHEDDRVVEQHEPCILRPGLSSGVEPATVKTTQLVAVLTTHLFEQRSRLELQNLVANDTQVLTLQNLVVRHRTQWEVDKHLDSLATGVRVTSRLFKQLRQR